MKAAIFIQEGTTQVVLTPENEWETAALQMIKSAENVTRYTGSFYECRGGWIRHDPNQQNDSSLIFRLHNEPKVVVSTPENPIV